MGFRMNQSLGIGIRNKKLHAFQPGRNHVVDSIATGAANPEHKNAGTQLSKIR